MPAVGLFHTSLEKPSKFKVYRVFQCLNVVKLPCAWQSILRSSRPRVGLAFVCIKRFKLEDEILSSTIDIQADRTNEGLVTYRRAVRTAANTYTQFTSLTLQLITIL